jgi:hypothetical protein
MKCLQCHRRVKDTWFAKFRHVEKYHCEILLSRAIQALGTEEWFFTIGKMFGSMTKETLNRTYGEFGKKS